MDAMVNSTTSLSSIISLAMSTCYCSQFRNQTGWFRTEWQNNRKDLMNMSPRDFTSKSRLMKKATTIQIFWHANVWSRGEWYKIIKISVFTSIFMIVHDKCNWYCSIKLNSHMSVINLQNCKSHYQSAYCGPIWLCYSFIVYWSLISLISEMKNTP